MLAPIGIDVLTLAQVPAVADLEVEETEDTFHGNALLKARAAAAASGLPTVADDSGLEVDALNGAPGVYSARFAGTDGDDAANNRKLIASLQGVGQAARTARFRCALVLFVPESHTGDTPFSQLADQATDGVLGEVAEGVVVREGQGTAALWNGTVEGRIIDEARGEGGFGYDPYFFLPEHGCTTAELEADVKNTISHRGQAVRQFVEALRG